MCITHKIRFTRRVMGGGWAGGGGGAVGCNCHDQPPLSHACITTLTVLCPVFAHFMPPLAEVLLQVSTQHVFHGRQQWLNTWPLNAKQLAGVLIHLLGHRKPWKPAVGSEQPLKLLGSRHPGKPVGSEQPWKLLGHRHPWKPVGHRAPM